MLFRQVSRALPGKSSQRAVLVVILKPVKLPEIFKALETCLGLEWIYKSREESGPFVREVRQLAKTFQVRQIRKLMQKYLGDNV